MWTSSNILISVIPAVLVAALQYNKSLNWAKTRVEKLGIELTEALEKTLTTVIESFPSDRKIDDSLSNLVDDQLCPKDATTIAASNSQTLLINNGLVYSVICIINIYVLFF